MARELDEFGAWRVGADHDHSFRLCTLQGSHRRGDRLGAALIGGFGRKRHAALFQSQLDAGQTVAAVGVVLVEDRDALDVAIFG